MKEKIQDLLSILNEGEPYAVDLYRPLYDLVSSIGLDYNYLVHHKTLQDKPIEELGLSEIATCLTFVVRGERFCEGLLEAYIKSGRLTRLLKRLDDLIQP